ncbi:FHA domain-containing protein [Dactylosporangium sp. CS-047395]|uniref:FHA domain-containing protein n=1 Tax=Dactylosporangium sp. CS-047395 TaxID=3239936 RepID=UPI003D8E0ACA
MARLVVEVDDQRYSLSPDDELTFGRDPSCTVCLAADDPGVSRTAGRIRVEDGTWCVTNMSRKRPLHIADANGFTLPLPVARAGWPLSRRAVDQARLTVLVPGDDWTYGLTLTLDAPLVGDPDLPAAPRNPVTTQVPSLRMTDNRREVLVALARGYLRPYPEYDPRPAGYDEIAAGLGLTRTQVTRRIEDVRDRLVESGVEGLDGARDTRRALCEWLLAMRLITAEDLGWLDARTAAAGRLRPAVPPVPPGPDTDGFAVRPQARVARAAHAAAAALGPVLAARLTARYGPGWLDVVNAARRSRGLPAGHGLGDDRFCLAVFARDEAVRGWAAEAARADAAALKSLADAAAHGRALSADAVTRAQHAADRLARWAATRPAVG